MPPLMFVDFETTGLDPFVDETIQISYLQIEHEDVMKNRFEPDDIKTFYIMPLTPQRAFLKVNGVCAADINGFNVEEWAKKDAFRWIDVNNFIYNTIRESRWVGVNPCFDYRFYTQLCNRHHITAAAPRDYHLLDISSLAYHLYVSGRIENVKLDTIAKHFNLSRKGKHHKADEDVLLSAQVYRAILF